MKFTVLGFNQDVALKYGLDLNDLCILRYFVDFVGSGDMKILIENNKPYYWLNYNYLKQEIPIINIASNDVIRRRLKKLVDKNILEHKLLKQKGCYPYYAFGVNYKNLISEKVEELPDSKVGGGATQKSEGYDSKVGTKINLLEDKSINNNIYSEIIDYLNKKTNSKYRANTKTNINLIKARLKEGFTLEDFIKVIDIKVAEWKGTKFEQYLRPQTLFRDKFESYLNQGGFNNAVTGKNKSDTQPVEDEFNFSRFSEV